MTMVDHLGNPNEILREKYTGELLKWLNTMPLECLHYCIAMILSTAA
jgi:hypothetical protein